MTDVVADPDDDWFPTGFTLARWQDRGSKTYESRTDRELHSQLQKQAPPESPCFQHPPEHPLSEVTAPSPRRPLPLKQIATWLPVKGRSITDARESPEPHRPS